MIKEELKVKSIKILKYIIYIFIFLGLSFAIYKIVNWKKVFESDFEKNSIVQRNIDLPPTIKIDNKNASSAVIVPIRDLTYSEKLWLETFIKRLKSQNIYIRQLEIGEYYDVNLIAENRTVFKVSTKIDVDKAWNNTISVLDSDKFRVDADSKSNITFDKLEYIDVRFDNKIFYKLHGTKENILGTSTAESN